MGPCRIQALTRDARGLLAVSRMGRASVSQGMRPGLRLGIGFVSLAASLFVPGVRVGEASAQDAGGGRPAVASKVDDAAGLFEEKAVAEVQKTALARLEKEYG